MQEAYEVGCGPNVIKECPKWMYNYLSNSKKYGGTENSTNLTGYWMISVSNFATRYKYKIISNGGYETRYPGSTANLRAVVEINK